VDWDPTTAETVSAGDRPCSYAPSVEQADVATEQKLRGEYSCQNSDVSDKASKGMEDVVCSLRLLADNGVSGRIADFHKVRQTKQFDISLRETPVRDR
jgi:hypothetical protein